MSFGTRAIKAAVLCQPSQESEGSNIARCCELDQLWVIDSHRLGYGLNIRGFCEIIHINRFVRSLKMDQQASGKNRNCNTSSHLF